MTQFENFQSMNIDQFAEWIDKYGAFDDSPWMTWWDENYCSKCESIECHYTDAKEKLGFEPFYERSIECAYCELNDKCRFFPELDKEPEPKDIVKMWLESEVE